MDNGIMLVAAFGILIWFIGQVIYFQMQQYHAMKLDEVHKIVVPRAEVQATTDKIMDKEKIMQALKMINDRLNSMEEK